MEVLLIFGLWDQEIDSWFTNRKPLIPPMNIIRSYILIHNKLIVQDILVPWKFQAHLKWLFFVLLLWNLADTYSGAVIIWPC